MKCDDLRPKLLLYAITPSTPRSKGRQANVLLKAVDAAIAGGATFVQLREKELACSDVFYEALEVKALCEARGVPFVIDDDVSLAARVGADGVHIGQDDASLEEARSLLGEEAIIGVSCQSVAQAVAAASGGASYIGVGAVFPTTSKDDAAAVPLATLCDICRAVDIPVVAVGGINEANMSLLRGTGIAGVALISAIFSSANIKATTEQLHMMAAHLFS